jgi:hypothetical protein
MSSGVEDKPQASPLPRLDRVASLSRYTFGRLRGDAKSDSAYHKAYAAVVLYPGHHASFYRGTLGTHKADGFLKDLVKTKMLWFDAERKEYYSTYRFLLKLVQSGNSFADEIQQEYNEVLRAKIEEGTGEVAPKRPLEIQAFDRWDVDFVTARQIARAKKIAFAVCGDLDGYKTFIPIYARLHNDGVRIPVVHVYEDAQTLSRADELRREGGADIWPLSFETQGGKVRDLVQTLSAHPDLRPFVKSSPEGMFCRVNLTETSAILPAYVQRKPPQIDKYSIMVVNRNPRLISLVLESLGRLCPTLFPPRGK